MRGDANPLSSQENRSIWSALGAYIAKELMNGRGVMVPKFGHFTFTAAEVDLQGTTNSHLRDHQLRKPVFMISKEFSASMALRSGIAYTNANGVVALRPHQLKGANGAIPKVKVNYVEISSICKKSKQLCRDACELIFKYLSEQARNNSTLQIEIPQVGRFFIRNSTAAVNFNQNMIEQTKGVTARTFTVGNIFGSSNAVMNLKLSDIQKKRGSFLITEGANQWLNDALGIKVDDEKLREQKFKTPLVMRARSKLNRAGSVSVLPLNKEQNIDDRWSYAPSSVKQSQRPMSAAYSSHSTEMASHMSILPPADRFGLMKTAQAIYDSRQQICQAVLAPGSNCTLRETMTPSQIFGTLKKVPVILELVDLKQLLNELGFPYNGPAASLTSLMTACKAYLHGVNRQTPENLVAPEMQMGDSGLTLEVSNGELKSQVVKVCDLLRDIIYVSKKTLLELFQIGSSTQAVDIGGYERIINEVGASSVSKKDIDLTWKYLAVDEKITFEQFQAAFKSEQPTGLNFETQVIQQVRQWMKKNSFSAEMAFNQLCRSIGKFTEMRMTRSQFHRACRQNDVGLAAVRVDTLFTALSTEANGEIDINMWKSRIYEDADNPIQMVREIVAKYNLTQDDMLFQMRLKVWDDPLDLQKLTIALRNLDQSMSDTQVKALYKVLKDRAGLITIPVLIQNFTGQPYETLEFRNKIFKQLYGDIYPDGEQRLIKMLCEKDSRNQGKVDSATLFQVLVQMLKSVSRQDCERFVRQVETDREGLISYMDFVSDLQKFGNQNHNPLKSIINRLSFFLNNNKLSGSELMTRLGSIDGVSVPIGDFATFLQAKVDKKRDMDQMKRFAAMIDVNKDGKVSAEDIDTCVKNLQNPAFWHNQNAALSQSMFNSKVKGFPLQTHISKDKTYEVIKQINTEIKRKRLTYGSIFSLCDANEDDMVSYAEFQRGIGSVLQISMPVLEQIYILMDKSGIGLVTYQQFVDVLRNFKIEKPLVADNFDWEQQTITRIREWIQNKKCTVEEAFKLFDQNVDGTVCIEDLRKSLKIYLGMKDDQINQTQLTRLFKLIDFFKIGRITQADFRRIIQGGVNPYTISASSRAPLTKALGGSFLASSTFDWKFCSVQQIGLRLSRQFPTLKESFSAASKGKTRVNYADFSEFVVLHGSLSGLNLTEPLVKQLFSELDPHKKGHLLVEDWINAFKVFDWKSQMLVELQDAMQSTFTDLESAFCFFLSLGSNKFIDKTCFKRAVFSLVGDHVKESDLEALWLRLSKDDQLTKLNFRKHFEDLSFAGAHQIQNYRNGRSLKARSTERPTIKRSLQQGEQWHSNVLSKLRGIIGASKRNAFEIFLEFDADGSGAISNKEFRNAIRKLGLGLTSKEIDSLMLRIDSNGDGKIDYQEFLSFVGEKQLDNELRQRVHTKLARLKELMILHMTSAIDAFRFFDPDGNGILAFSDFHSLVLKVHELANEKAPNYAVIRDYFEVIDIRRDGALDADEWGQTFGKVWRGSSALSIRPTAATQWENSKDLERIGVLLAKNRKQLVLTFKRVLAHSGDSTKFTFREGKAALQDWLQNNFGGHITDEQLRCVFHVGLDSSQSSAAPKYDYVRMLDVYRQRSGALQSF